MMTRFRTRAILSAMAAALAALVPAAALSAEARIQDHRIQFQYLALPDTLFVSSERQMDVCLVNHGTGGGLNYDEGTIADRDQVVVSIPVGPAYDDLTEEPLVFACSSQRPDWLCLGPYAGAERALLVLRPAGPVRVSRGETLCFRIAALNVNAEVGRAELRVSQRLAENRAKPPLNDRMAVFKTDLQAMVHDDLSGVRPDQHHEKTTSFADLVDQASDAQVPDDITVGYAATAGTALTAVDADTVDGMHAEQLLPRGFDQWVNEAGDTMTGPLTLPGPPVEALHAATKAYADEARGEIAYLRERLCEDLRLRRIVPPPSLECGFKIVFVTRGKHNGNIGGVSGGDASCQSRANQAGLEGTYKAWLGGFGEDPLVRFTKSDRPYIRTDGATVAESWSDLTDQRLSNPINHDEAGELVAHDQELEAFAYVWTGVQPSGLFSGSDCTKWTTSSIDANGSIGDYEFQDSWWTNVGPGEKDAEKKCSYWHHLYCVQQ